MKRFLILFMIIAAIFGRRAVSCLTTDLVNQRSSRDPKEGIGPSGAQVSSATFQPSCRTAITA